MNDTTHSKSNLPVSALVEQLKPNHEISKPYYQQILRQLSAMIDNGELEPGYTLPSERDLAEALKVSRTTIKHCYDELRNANQLTTHGRGGTVVQGTPRISPVLGRLKGFTEEMQELGMAASTRVMEHEVVQDRTIASIFQRPASAHFLRLVRVRLGNDVPMTREVAWYDLSAAQALEHWDTKGSAYQFLREQCNINLTWAEQTIEAVMSSTEEAKVFGYGKAEPCLLLKRRTYSAANQIIEYVEGTFRGEAYAYKLKLGL